MITSRMSSFPVESIVDLCRICEASDASIDIIVEHEQRLAFKYFIVTDIEVETDDGLPTTLCKSCVNELKACFDFKVKCLRADSKWRRIISEPCQVDVESETESKDDNVNSDNLENTEYIPTVIEENESASETEIESTNESDSSQEDSSHILEEKEAWHNSKFDCETCNTGFNNRDEYREHIKIHGLRRFQCEKCMKWFKYKFHLKVHQKEQCINPMKFHCDICSQSYSNRANLRRHIREIHEEAKPFECEICGKRFAQKSVLQSHTLVHNPHGAFSCSECHRQYKRQKSLIMHEQTHLPKELRDPELKRPKRVQVKICVCTYCGKIFNTQAAHDGHVRIHTKETPYSCTLCPKKFRIYSTLRTHKLIHTNEKPHKCATCGACFRQAAHLKTHNLRHTNERKHVCLICSKTFALRGNLNTHMKIHAAQSAANIQMRKEV